MWVLRGHSSLAQACLIQRKQDAAWTQDQQQSHRSDINDVTTAPLPYPGPSTLCQGSGKDRLAALRGPTGLSLLMAAAGPAGGYNSASLADSDTVLQQGHGSGPYIRLNQSANGKQYAGDSLCACHAYAGTARGGIVHRADRAHRRSVCRHTCERAVWSHHARASPPAICPHWRSRAGDYRTFNSGAGDYRINARGGYTRWKHHQRSDSGGRTICSLAVAEFVKWVSGSISNEYLRSARAQSTRG